MPINADGLEKHFVDPRKDVSTLRMDVTPTEAHCIGAITARANHMAPAHGYKIDVIELAMDLAAVHLNDFPIDFVRWIYADDLTFFQEIVNLTSHVDRTTGKIRHGFALKFSRKIVQQ